MRQEGVVESFNGKFLPILVLLLKVSGRSMNVFFFSKLYNFCMYHILNIFNISFKKEGNKLKNGGMKEENEVPARN